MKTCYLVYDSFRTETKKLDENENLFVFFKYTNLLVFKIVCKLNGQFLSYIEFY